MDLQTIVLTQTVLSIILFAVAFFYWNYKKDNSYPFTSVVGTTFLLLIAITLQAVSYRKSEYLFVAWLVTFGALLILFLISNKHYGMLKHTKKDDLQQKAMNVQEDPDVSFFKKELLTPVINQYHTAQKNKTKEESALKSLQETILKKKDYLAKLDETLITKTKKSIEQEKKLEQKQKDLLKKERELKIYEEDLQSDLKDVKSLKQHYEEKQKILDKESAEAHKILAEKTKLKDLLTDISVKEKRLKEREEALKNKQAELKLYKKQLETKEDDLEDKEDDLLEREKKIKPSKSIIAKALGQTHGGKK